MRKYTLFLLLILLTCVLASPIAAQDAPPPEQLLLAADRYLLNGYYENAVATYQMVVDQGESVPREQRAAALYGLGRAAVREGIFYDAVNALSTFIDQYGDDARAPLVRFLRGDAFLGLSLYEQAIIDFQAYIAARPGLIDSYAWERIGDAQLALEQTDEALASYSRAADASRSNIPLAALRERVAQVYLSVGRPADAVAQYDQILLFAQNTAYRATIEFEAAATLLNAGSTVDALVRLERIFAEYADQPAAYQAMLLLEENVRTLDDLARGRVAFTYGDYPLAVEAFTRYSTRRPLTEVPAELHLLLGRAYREIGNTAAALTAFQTIIDTYPTDPAFGEALLEQGRTYFIGQDIPAAIRQYERIAEEYDYLPEAPEALWRAGYLYLTNEQPSEGRATFDKLADLYPESAQATDGLFLAASAAFTANDTAAAERYYAQIATLTTGEDQAQALLQVGRLAITRGDSNVATQAFQQAVRAAPDSYYGTRAQDIVAGTAAFQRPADTQFFYDDAALVGEAEAWLRTTFPAITQEGALWPLSASLEADPRLVRGRELWLVGAYDEARNEFSDLLDANETDALASYQLAIFLRGLAAYQDSIVAAANVIRTAGVGTLEAPRYIARMRYPAYYLDVVKESADRYNLDPLLMFSLIRHESLFDTYATAAAGEKGLTQVIPPTADYIAAELNWPNYQHSVLFRPYAGAEFGAFYLAEQLRTFDGNVTAALGGYNAGPGRALNWIELSGGDHDLFLTAISIDSTRLYVQRIYGYYAIYRALYGV